LSFVGVDEFSVWQIVHSDSVFSTNNKPVDLGGEKKNVNWGLGIDLIQVSTFNKVPNVDLAISSTGSNEHGVLSEVKAVDLGLVSNEGVHQTHGLVIPDLDGSIPRSRDDNWVSGVVIESNAGNPVKMWILVDGELANTIDVPDLDALVDGARDDLSVIWGESNREDILSVTKESLEGAALVQVPESDSSIPR